MFDEFRAFEFVQLLLALAEYAHALGLWQSRVPRAPSFLYFPQTSLCVAVVCWFLLRGCVFRPDDACQKRFSWFPEWSQKAQTCVNLVELVKSFQTSFIWRQYS